MKLSPCKQESILLGTGLGVYYALFRAFLYVCRLLPLSGTTANTPMTMPLLDRHMARTRRPRRKRSPKKAPHSLTPTRKIVPPKTQVFPLRRRKSSSPHKRRKHYQNSPSTSNQHLQRRQSALCRAPRPRGVSLRKQSWPRRCASPKSCWRSC